ncbi:hypothetical protein KKB99_02165, partial [bacterium]|nr:hypothetical protein [bacterium]MBU1024792.1 hypothetical protein [bacterium]
GRNDISSVSGFFNSPVSTASGNAVILTALCREISRDVGKREFQENLTPTFLLERCYDRVMKDKRRAKQIC